MAWREQLKTNQGKLMMNIGTTTSGQVRTKAVSVGTLSDNASDWNIDKFGAIANAISEVLLNALYEINHVATYKVLS